MPGKKDKTKNKSKGMFSKIFGKQGRHQPASTEFPNPTGMSSATSLPNILEAEDYSVPIPSFQHQASSISSASYQAQDYSEAIPTLPSRDPIDPSKPILPSQSQASAQDYAEPVLSKPLNVDDPFIFEARRRQLLHDGELFLPGDLKRPQLDTAQEDYSEIEPLPKVQNVDNPDVFQHNLERLYNQGAITKEIYESKRSK